MTQADETLSAARETARRVVREQFPDLSGVEPQIAEHTSTPLHPGDALRLGTLPRTNATTAYTFIFTRELHTADGFSIPRIARVTIDSQQHVLKVVLSK